MPGKLITDAAARELVKGFAAVMEKAGLHPYVSPKYTDSRLGGLCRAYNSCAWQMHDGDSTDVNVKGELAAGQAEVGVAVWGSELGLYKRGRYGDDDEDEDSFELDHARVDLVGSRIERLFRSLGVTVVSVRVASYDSGFGTRNVDYSIVFKK